MSSMIDSTPKKEATKAEEGGNKGIQEYTDKKGWSKVRSSIKRGSFKLKKIQESPMKEENGQY